MSTMMQASLIIGLGVVGATARYALMLASRFLGDSFKMTLLINLVGCFFCGYMLTYGNESVPYRIVGIGLLGGFTTFSAFSLDLTMLLERHRWLSGLIYVVMSAVGGVVCVAAGYVIGLQFS